MVRVKICSRNGSDDTRDWSRSLFFGYYIQEIISQMSLLRTGLFLMINIEIDTCSRQDNINKY